MRLESDLFHHLVPSDEISCSLALYFGRQKFSKVWRNKNVAQCHAVSSGMGKLCAWVVKISQKTVANRKRVAKEQFSTDKRSPGTLEIPTVKIIGPSVLFDAKSSVAQLNQHYVERTNIFVLDILQDASLEIRNILSCKASFE